MSLSKYNHKYSITLNSKLEKLLKKSQKKDSIITILCEMFFELFYKFLFCVLMQKISLSTLHLGYIFVYNGLDGCEQKKLF